MRRIPYSLGDRFARLTLVEIIGGPVGRGRQRMGVFRCDCAEQMRNTRKTRFIAPASTWPLSAPPAAPASLRPRPYVCPSCGSIGGCHASDCEDLPGELPDYYERAELARELEDER